MTHWINLHILDYVYIDKCILPAITLTKTTNHAQQLLYYKP